MNIRAELAHFGFRTDAMHPAVLRRDDGYSVSRDRMGTWSLWHSHRVETRNRFVYSSINLLSNLEPELLTAYLHILPPGDQMTLPGFFREAAR